MGEVLKMKWTHARHNAASQHIVEKLQNTYRTEHLRTERVGVNTGHATIDKVVPSYFGVGVASFSHTQCWLS